MKRLHVKKRNYSLQWSNSVTIRIFFGHSPTEQACTIPYRLLFADKAF